MSNEPAFGGVSGSEEEDEAAATECEGLGETPLPGGQPRTMTR